VPIDVGSKVAGKLGRTKLGLLGVRTRAVELADAANPVISRVKWDLLDSPTSELVFTDGDPPPRVQAGPAAPTCGSRRRASSAARATSTSPATRRSVREEGRPGLVLRVLRARLNDRFDAQIVLGDIRRTSIARLRAAQERRLIRVAGGYPRPRDFLGV
jgi:hypothetical protein